MKDRDAAAKRVLTIVVGKKVSRLRL